MRHPCRGAGSPMSDPGKNSNCNNYLLSVVSGTKETHRAEQQEAEGEDVSGHPEVRGEGRALRRRRRNKTARSRTGRAPACVRHAGKGMGHKTRAEEKQELDRAGLHRPREEGWLPFQERWQPPLGFEQASLCFSKITL